MKYRGGCTPTYLLSNLSDALHMNYIVKEEVSNE